MEWLKQSTAATIVLGPFLDSTDGNSPETLLAIAQADIRLSKNGAAFAQTDNIAGATHMESGEYSIPLNTTDTDTLGRLRVRVHEDGALAVWKDCLVVPINVYNTLVLGTDILTADIRQISGEDQSMIDLKDFADAGYDPATNNVTADIVKISGDSAAADNLEATYDGTGYTEDSAPATQEQVGRLTSGTAAINTTAESFTKAGAEPETNTYTATVAEDGTYHIVEDDAGSTDCYYQFNVGGNGVPVSITWIGYAQSQGDSYTIWAYNYGTTTYEQIGSIAGLAGTTPIENTYDLTNAHVGTGANLGKVRFRFLSADGTALATDRILCSYAIVTKTAGYSNGSIFANSNISNENTEPYVDGTADNPVSTWAAVKSLSASLGINQFDIANGSSFTLDSDSTNYTLLGHDYILALGGQILENTHIQEAAVSGIATAGSGEIHFEHCHVGDCTLGKAHTCCSALEGTIIISAAETYIFNNCYASDGLDPPIIDFNDIAATVRLSNWQGGIKVKNMAAGSKITVQGAGKVIIDITCDAGGTIGISGNMTRQDDVSGGFSGTINEDARIDVGQINDECDQALTDYGANTTVPDVAGTAPTAVEIRQEMDSNSVDLNTIIAYVDELESRLTAARAGYLDNLNGHTSQTGDSYAIVNDGTHGNAALETLVDEIETLLKNATYGLAALRTRGDVAWLTATGFSTHNAADVKTAIEAAESHLALIKAKTDALPSGIAKNVVLPKFDTFMVLSSDHVSPATGKTITGQISKDGGAFVGITNAITEVGNGVYAIASGFTQTEMNADVITLKFTETDCDQRIITIYTT